MSKANWISFKINSRKLLTVDLIFKSRSAGENSDLLTNAITTAAELSIPQHKKKKGKRLKPLPYWNEDCKNAIRDRKKQEMLCTDITLVNIGRTIVTL